MSDSHGPLFGYERIGRFTLSCGRTLAVADLNTPRRGPTRAFGRPVGSPAVFALHACLVATAAELPLQGGVSVSRTALGSFAALTAVTVLAAGTFALYSHRYRGHGDTARTLSRIRPAFRIGLPVVYLLALLAMTAAGWLDLLSTLPGQGTVVGDTAELLVGLPVPSVAVVGAYLGAFPAVRELREADMTATAAARRLLRYLAGIGAVAVTLVVLVTRLTGRFWRGGGVFVAVALLAVVLWAGAPWLIRLVQTTRAPTDEERARLDSLCAEAGLDLAGVRVLETDGARQAYAVLRGLPGRRHLFVTDYLLAALDDERLRAYLAIQGERARLGHLAVKLVAVAGSLAGAVWLVTGGSLPGVPDGVAAVAVLAVGAVALWLGQRLVYRADAAAAARTSPAAVAAAIERYADLNDVPMSWGRVAALRRMEPPLGRRLDRIGECDGPDNGESGEGGREGEDPENDGE
jgi:hypothetical protein